MSAPSGIKVPDDLKTAFSTAQADASDVRALVFVIQGESFKHITTVKPKGDYKEDTTLLAETLPNPKTPASFAYRLDSKELGKFEWMMVTYVPDDAAVRAKMLQASSRAGLLKALGANNFKHDWFATSTKDLTPAALSAYLKHLASPPPLSAAEAALAEVREAEAAEAKRVALDPEAESRRKRAVVGLAGKFSWGDGVQDALDKVALCSDDGWIVCLEIPTGNTSAISLIRSEACTPSHLASKLPDKSPCYTFYSYPTPAPPPQASIPTHVSSAPISSPRNTFQASQGGVRVVQAGNAPPVEEEKKEDEPDKENDKESVETPDVNDLEIKEAEQEPEKPAAVPDKPVGKGRVIFIYTCPSSSPIKSRMVYSSGVRSVQQDASDKADVEIATKLETSDISDLTESYLKSSLGPAKPSHSSSLPTQKTTSSSLSQAPAFGGAFGRPRPSPSLQPVRSATQVPLPASTGPSTPVSATPGEDEDSKEGIRRAFDAFGPRVGGGGGGFARPRPAGKR
ncbi:hypothetical protein BCR39DRAFT_483792 [Naematelia encephala]|uniref:ADF-H domain-containing protein n=1 Tax=Naematelia encephala TaxID=71784 RepID=A0A1Y2AX97_9TREE|nr:hypothetical protein BCR39DRAFT_483792 [Naematelia encephala]